MKINLQKIVSDFSSPEELENFMYFKQLNVYETISFNNNVYKMSYCTNQELDIYKIEYTIPTVDIISTKIIKTMEGTSLEGQHLTGKKLVVIGEINLSLLLTYHIGCNKCNTTIKDVNIPFSTFIIIPKDTCNEDVINLRYLIEDVSSGYLGNSKTIVSVTLLIQYLEEYIK